MAFYTPLAFFDIPEHEPAVWAAKALNIPMGSRAQAEALLAAHLPGSRARGLCGRPWAGSDVPRWAARVGALQAALTGLAGPVARDLSMLLDASGRMVPRPAA